MKKLLSLLFLFLFFSEMAKSCTIVAAGKDATVDGSVITSHTDACDNCRLVVVPAQIFPPGSRAPVYWGIQDPLVKHGEWKVLGYIPQVEKTFTYIHSGYSHINEHQLAIGESTTAQRDELQVKCEGAKQIITIEQAMIFALQRCKKAREAVLLITSLIEKYGFLPSCGNESETLAIADPGEVWILEVLSVGPGWDPDSGELGAIWAAQRVQDDQIAVVPNWLIIQEMDLSDPGRFMASENYMKKAVEQGWYDPNRGKPFNWQEAYAPTATEWAISRLWLFYSSYCPSAGDWPNKKLDKPYKQYDPYHQTLEPISMYPFSARPDTLISVQDVMAFQRSVFEGTIYDMTADTDWLVPDGKGGYEKSPLTTPFPTPDMRHLLDINFRRNVSKGGYGMIAQLRSWLPDPIGGVYWFFVDNQHVGAYVPIYAGVQKIHPYYQTYNPEKYEEGSVRWAVDFVDNLLYLKWQDAIQDVRAVRDPMEKIFFEERDSIDKQALKLYKKDSQKARDFLTEYSLERMKKVGDAYLELRDQLIARYTNNHVRP